MWHSPRAFVWCFTQFAALLLVVAGGCSQAKKPPQQIAATTETAVQPDAAQYVVPSVKGHAAADLKIDMPAEPTASLEVVAQVNDPTAANSTGNIPANSSANPNPTGNQPGENPPSSTVPKVIIGDAKSTPPPGMVNVGQHSDGRPVYVTTPFVIMPNGSTAYPDHPPRLPITTSQGMIFTGRFNRQGYGEFKREFEPNPNADKLPAELVLRSHLNQRRLPPVDLATLPGIDVALLKEVQGELERVEQPLEPVVLKRTTRILPLVKKERYREPNPVALSADGSRLAVLDLIEGCTVWDTVTLKEICNFPYPSEKKYPEIRNLRHSTRMTSEGRFMTLTNDGKFVAIAGHFQGIKIFNADTGELVHTHTDHQQVDRIQFSADGKWMAALESPWQLKRFPTTGGEVSGIDPKRLTDKMTFGDEVAISANGSVLAVHETSTGVLLLTNFAKATTGVVAVPSSDGLIGLTLSEDFAVQLLNKQLEVVITSLAEFKDNKNSAYSVARRPFCQTSDQVAITSDQKQIMTLSGPNMEVHPLEYNVHPWVFKLQAPHGPFGKVLAVSADGHTVLQNANGHKVVIWEFPDFPLSNEALFIKLLDGYLAGQQFDKLDALAAILEHDREPFPWNLTEPRYFHFIRQMLNRRPSGGQFATEIFIDQWLNANPKSRPAQLLQAQLEISHAWRARGGGLANTVTADGWKLFAKHLAKARKILMPLAQGKPACPHAISLLATVARGESWPAEDREKLISLSLESGAAWYGPIHDEMVETLLPRWVGERGDAVRYGNRVYRAMGDLEGSLMYLRIAGAASKFYPYTLLFENEPFDYHRMHAGFRVLKEQYPDHPSMPMYELWLHTVRPNPDLNLCRQLIETIDRQGRIWSEIPGLEGYRVQAVTGLGRGGLPNVNGRVLGN